MSNIVLLSLLAIDKSTATIVTFLIILIRDICEHRCVMMMEIGCAQYISISMSQNVLDM